MLALTHTETRQGSRTRRCGRASSPESKQKVYESVTNSVKFSKEKKGNREMRHSACLGAGRPLPVVAGPRRRPESPRASATGGGDDNEKGEKKQPTATTSQSSPSPPPPPRPPPPDPEKRWRRLWGGNPHGVYRVPGVSDWIARAPQVRVRSRTDRQVRERREKLKEREQVNDLFDTCPPSVVPSALIQSNRAALLDRATCFVRSHLIRIAIEPQEERRERKLAQLA